MEDNRAPMSELEEKKRQKRLTAVVSVVIAISILAAIALVNLFLPITYWDGRYSSLTPRSSGDMRIHFLDVGQGDCAVIELPDGKNIMIDAGNGKTETTNNILRYIHELGIKKFDYLIASHGDLDHVGGMKTVFEETGANTVYLPHQEEFTRLAAYSEFYNAVTQAEEVAVVYTERYQYIEGEGYV